MIWSILAFSALFFPSLISAQCANGCSGRGFCSVWGVCTCDSGFTGADCSLRACPRGTAWSEYPSATDTAHQILWPCSNMGICNTATGLCTCNTGYEGAACERMSCPVSSSQICSGNGVCKSMREAAIQNDLPPLSNSLSYNIWDADKIYGCICDDNYTGYDCSIKTCVTGDDVLTTGQVDEVQTLSCSCGATCSGSFILVYNDEASVPIYYSDTIATLTTKINGIRRINGVSISSLSSVVCGTGGASVDSVITFTYNPGDLKLLVIKSNTLASTSQTAPILTIVETTAGTKENAVCSNRGRCDSFGECECLFNYATSGNYFQSSNDYFQYQTVYGSVMIPNCHTSTGLTVTGCPDINDGNGACGGHGVCSGSPQYTCTCYPGYGGFACQYLTCASGKNWFEEAKEANVAHFTYSECSNRGICSRTKGVCTCQSGFTGLGCSRMACANSCSSRGVCRTMSALAQRSTTNGDLLGITYGFPNSATPSTWDQDMIQGCDCDRYYYHGPLKWDISDFAGYDCSQLTCPSGNDPVLLADFPTNLVYETQKIVCTADSGFFTITFRQQKTIPITYSATTTVLTAALNALKTVRQVTVSYSSGTAACSASGVTITVTFTQVLGDLPLLSVTTTSLALSTGSPSAPVTESVTGVAQNVECSNRGLCNHLTGQCKCFDGFTSSNGAGATGARADCGFQRDICIGST